MVVLAQAEFEDGFIVPIPFEHTPKESRGNELIIVAIDSNPPSSKTVNDVYSFYGAENTQKFIGVVPPKEDEKTVFCIPIHCILEKACSLSSSPPPDHISPLWTKDRFGISSVEAQIVGDASRKMLKSVNTKMRKIRKDLTRLNIKIYPTSIETIRNCETMIRQAQEQMEKTRKDCRWFAAEHVAHFLRKKYKVDAWVETLVEAAVLFCVEDNINDDKATILGTAIEGAINEIEPDTADRFFDDYVYDASVFPIVMDVSFVNGTRVTNRREYHSVSGGKS